MPATFFVRGGGTRLRFRNYVVSRKVVGSIPDDVIETLFISPNPSSCTIPLVLTPSLNRNEYQKSSWGIKNGRQLSLAVLLLFVGRLSRKYGILDV
jgi:hypothetical protein